MKSFLLIAMTTLFFACQESPAKEISAVPSDSKDTTAPKSTRPNGTRGKGSLSFKLNGQLYETDPSKTKCWSTTTVPLAMLMAKGDGLSISWQMGYTTGQSDYKMEGDKQGTINFTIGDKTYWTRRVTGANYLDIKITSAKNYYNVILLSGTFEGVLEDKDGNKVQITEGKFVTEAI
jgi:hypothetical protein